MRSQNSAVTPSISAGPFSGDIYTPSNGTRIEESENAVYSIDGDDPLSAKVEIKHEIQMEFVAAAAAATDANVEKVQISTWSEMSADANHFFLRNKLTTKLNGSVFFEREWNDEVNR